MPKMKTHKSSASRFKATSGGKLLRGHPGKRHKQAGKSSKRKRNLSRRALVPQGMLKMYKKMMGVS